VKFPVTEEALGVGITFVLFDPKSGSKGKPSSTIFAGFASVETGLYQSTDGGATFKPVAGQPKGVMPSHAALDGDGVLYLSYGNVPGPSDVVTGSVWKYEVKKNAWKDITPVVPKDPDKFGYGGLAVDAQHPGTVMVTTIDRWTVGDEIFRTTDGGRQWTALAPKAVRDIAGARYLYWDHEKPSSTGWMGDIDIDPFNPGRATYVTGQGIWMSEDANAAPAATHWVFQNRGLEECVVPDLASPPEGPLLISAVADLGGFRHDSLSDPSSRGMFQNPIFGSGTSVDFAEAKPDIWVRVGTNDKGRRGAYSTDAGNTWTPFATEPLESKGSGVIAVSADGATFLWVPRGAKASISRDRGAQWSPAQGLPAPPTVPDWAPSPLKVASDRVNPRKLYAFDLIEGKAYASSDGGAQFKETDSGLPALPEYSLTVGSIQTVPGVEGDVWLSTGKELFRSTDSGEHYDTVSSFTESYGVGFGKAAPGQKYPAVYVAAKLNGVDGLFRSDDGGNDWVRINDDRHQFGGVTVLAGDPRTFGRVYVGTGGRGILYGVPR
jgi:hypothetical protein